MTIEDFLLFLYLGRLPDKAYVTIWDKPLKRFEHFQFPHKLSNLVECVDSVVANKHDAYYGVGLRKADLGIYRKGTKTDVAAIPGFWLDIDIAGPGHRSERLPPDQTAALIIIDKCPFPEPTLIVNTGGGLHAYWLFDHVFVGHVDALNRSSKAFQDAIIQSVGGKYHIDQTGNIDRVLRLPGTRNFKAEPSREIEVIYGPGCDHGPGPRYTFEQLNLVQSKVSAPTPCSPLKGVDALKAHLLPRIRHLARDEGRIDLFEEVFAGRPFAGVGERDTLLYNLVCTAAFLVPDGTTPEQLAEVFKASLEEMAAEDPADIPEKDRCPSFGEAIRKCAEGLKAAAEDREKKRLEEERFKQALMKGTTVAKAEVAALVAEGPVTEVTSASLGSIEDESEYTPEDLMRFSSAQGTTPPGFNKRWIIQHGNAFYVFVRGSYRYPVVREALVTKVRDDLAPAAKLGVQVWMLTKDSGQRLMKLNELMQSYGTVARQTKSSLTLAMSRYDAATEIFWEAVCPPRQLQPVYDGQVDAWLRLLGGAEPESLLDWIATATTPYLDRQSSCLYLSGKQGAGKTMLAHGLARLWTEGGPAELADVVGGSFNADIARCPLIFGDETMSCSTKDLRSLVGSTLHTIRRKFMPNVELEGSVRVMLADNSGRMLLRDGEEIVNKDDMEAVARKFLHILVSNAPVDYLSDLGGRVGTADWVSGDRIARHALWLSQNRAVVSGNRFLVEGSATKTADMLAVLGKVPELVCEWIVGYLDRPIPNVTQNQSAIVGNKKILINVDAIYEHWSIYIKSERLPVSKHKIGTSLGNLSRGTERVENKRYHVVRPELIFGWAEMNSVGDIDRIRKRVEDPPGTVQSGTVHPLKSVP